MIKTTEPLSKNYDFSTIIEEAEHWIDSQQILNKKISSCNHVFKIDEPKTGKPLAYLKIGIKGEEGTARMEAIVFRISSLLGIKHFAPTTLVTFPIKNDRKEIEVSKANQVIDVLKFPLICSLQPALEGKLLSEHLNDVASSLDQPLPKWTVAKAILRMMTIGGFDFHNDNIFVTKDRKIKCFDNGRSFPNSEKWILFRYSGIIPSIRCALFNLPQTAEILKIKEIHKMIMILQRYQKNLPQIKNSLNLSESAKRLPWKWLDLDQAILALEKRLNGMISILKTMLNMPDANLDDFLYLCNPYYRISFATQHLIGLIENRFQWDFDYAELKQRFIHSQIGKEYLDGQIEKLINRRYDIKTLISYKEAANFKKLTKKVRAFYLQSKSITDFVNETISAAEKLINNYFQPQRKNPIENKMEKFFNKPEFDIDKFIKIFSEILIDEIEFCQSISLIKSHPTNFLKQFFDVYQNEMTSIQKKKIKYVKSQDWINFSITVIKSLFYSEKLMWLIEDLAKKIQIYEEKKIPEKEKKEFFDLLFSDLQQLFFEASPKNVILSHTKNSIESLLKKGTDNSINHEYTKKLIYEIINNSKIDNKDTDSKTCYIIRKQVFITSLTQLLKNQAFNETTFLEIEHITNEFFESFEELYKIRKIQKVKLDFMVLLINLLGCEKKEELETCIEKGLEKAINLISKSKIDV